MALEDVKILAVSDVEGRRRLQRQQQPAPSKRNGQPLQEQKRRSLQQDGSDASEQPSGGSGVQIDYSVVASSDISAAFTADDFVARFVAAVN
eukprot:COSAG06_NODE_53890_length_297_cov_1.080808_1_plen_91_part_10